MESKKILNVENINQMTLADVKNVLSEVKSANKHENKYIITVAYEDFKPETYQGVFLESDKGMTIFNTGNFITDFKEAVRNSMDLDVRFSSTIDHYIADLSGQKDEEEVSECHEMDKPCGGDIDYEKEYHFFRNVYEDMQRQNDTLRMALKAVL
jgi:type IV secretory pathway VirB4 component